MIIIIILIVLLLIIIIMIIIIIDIIVIIIFVIIISIAILFYGSISSGKSYIDLQLADNGPARCTLNPIHVVPRCSVAFC